MMPEFLVPDIKRHQLEDIILNIKSLDIKQDRVEKFMKLLIEPPEPVRVASALKVLEGVGALDPEQKVCNKQIEFIKETETISEEEDPVPSVSARNNMTTVYDSDFKTETEENLDLPVKPTQM